MKINIIGGGLAGVEASYYLARNGYKVNLYDLKPDKLGPAFHYKDFFGELVCSNSLKSVNKDNASGLLKGEMEALSSLIMEASKFSKLPSGQDLVVDREVFSSYITNKIKDNKNITIISKEVSELEEGEDIYNIVCTGPLTSSPLIEYFKGKYSSSFCSFYDAASPLIYLSSLDTTNMYYKSRYDKGEGKYLNVPLTSQEYYAFNDALVSGERVELHDFEHFEGCLPIETMASRGRDTLRFGPLKPKGLETEGNRPYAVVQLRQDDVAGSLYNLVGFQTNLKYSEQKRILSMLPGFKDVKFARFGLMHRNTYISAPEALNRDLSLKNDSNTYIGGQFSGVEGYVESAATGLLAAIYLRLRLENKKGVYFPINTMMGSLVNYLVMSSPKHFAPMNANYGIYQYPFKMSKEEVYDYSIKSIEEWLKKNF